MSEQKIITGSCTRKLTATLVNGAKTDPAKRYEVRDAGNDGLTLRVGKTGRKVWYLYYRNRDGKRQSYRIGPTHHYSLKEARNEADKLKAGIASGSDPAEQKRADKAAQAASEARTTERFLDRTYRASDEVKHRIRSRWQPFMDRDMATITADELDAYRDERLNKITTNTYRRDRTVFKVMLDAAVDKGFIGSNPFDKSANAAANRDKRVRYLGQRDEHEALHHGERARLLAALNNREANFQVMVKLALNTGMRRGEICKLRWKEVSFKNKHITILAANAKTNKARHLPMNTTARQLLADWKRQFDVIEFDGLVFPSPKSGDVYTSLKCQWRNLVKEARVKDFRFHDLRHDFASRLVMADVSLYKVKELLGHSSIKMTERYAHLAPKDLQIAVEAIAEQY